MRVVVIGAGGTGSYLIPLLQKQLGSEDTVVVVDGDKFERKNMDRQLFNPSDIGKNKAESLVRMYSSKRYTSGAQLVAVPEFLRDPISFADEHAGITAVIACADNHRARVACLVMADEIGCKAIICGNEFDCASASIYVPEYKETGADLRLRYPDLLENLEAHDPTRSCTGEVQEQEGNRQLALANFMSAGFGMALLYKWVIDPVEEKDLTLSQPFEMRWTNWGVDKSISIKDAMREYEELCDGED